MTRAPWALLMALLPAACGPSAGPIDWSRPEDPRVVEGLADLFQTSAEATIEIRAYIEAGAEHVILDLPRAERALEAVDPSGWSREALESGFRAFVQEAGWTFSIEDASGEFTCDDERVPGRSQCRLPVGTLIIYVDRLEPVDREEAALELGLNYGETDLSMGASTDILRLRLGSEGWELVSRDSVLF